MNTLYIRWLKLNIWRVNNESTFIALLFAVCFFVWLSLQGVALIAETQLNLQQQRQAQLIHETIQDLIQEKITNHE